MDEEECWPLARPRRDRNREYRARRRAAGLCGYEGCKQHSSPFYYCAEHRAADRSRHKMRRLERLAPGRE